MTTFTRILALLVITPVFSTAPAEASSDWADEIAASVSEIQAADADFTDGVLHAEPIITRAGYPRFVGEWTRDERAAPLMLQRLLDGHDHPAVQAALVEALPRTGGEWDDAIADLWDETSNATVRRMMVLTLEKADANVAYNALRAAASSDDAEIRAAAVRAMTWRKDADRFTSVFITGLQDRNDDVRSLAARASGLHKLESAKLTLAGMLDSESRDNVRLAALIALGQIDAEYARSLSSVTRLSRDTDQTIARTATRMLTP